MINQTQDSTILTGTPVTNSVPTRPQQYKKNSNSIGTTPMDDTTEEASNLATKNSDIPIVEEDSQPVVDVVRPLPPPPLKAPKKDDSYAPEYSIFFVIYILIGFMYMIHSGVDLPTEFNNFLFKNPHYINMTLSSLYFALSIVYIMYFHPKNESKNGEAYRSFIVCAILITIMTGWDKIYQKHNTTPTMEIMPQSATTQMGF